MAISTQAHSRLLSYLEYPKEWLEFDMYTPSLAEMQLEEVLHRLGVRLTEFLKMPEAMTLTTGAEHFRAAAITHWLQQNRSTQQTASLRQLIILDPDEPMARAFMRQLVASGRNNQKFNEQDKSSS